MAPAADERSDIFVFRTNTGEFRVEPGTFVTPAERRVSIRNLTARDIAVHLPARWPRRRLNVPPGGRGIFAIPRVVGGVYVYHVSIDGAFDAVGHSEPTIIVDP